MKKFKAKKRKKKLLFYLVLIIIAYVFTTKFLMKLELQSSNEEFIKSMLNDSNHYKKYEKTNYLNFFMKYILNLDIKEPNKILESVFKYKGEPNNEELDTTYVINEKDPIIYIYNTHENEEYIDNNLKDYNINPTVQMASYLLEGLLEKEGINTIVEEGNMSEYLKNNNLDYNESYQASRYYLEETLNKYPDLKLIIDLHRDAVSHSRSTTNIDGLGYAKVLFVIGTNYETYEQNLSLANKLNDMIKSKYPTLTRGVLTKDGTGTRCRFNQDLKNNIVLIEVGGNENTIDEVMNTIVVLKDIIKEYVGE